MSREIIERCDVCGQVVSDVLRDDDRYSPLHHGYGYIQVKRYQWNFGPWPRLWHRNDLGFEIVCDHCLDAVRELRESRRSERGSGGQT